MKLRLRNQSEQWKIKAKVVLARNKQGTRNEAAAAARRILDGRGTIADRQVVHAEFNRNSSLGNSVYKVTQGSVDRYQETMGDVEQLGGQFSSIVQAQRSGQGAAQQEQRFFQSLLSRSQDFLQKQVPKLTKKLNYEMFSPRTGFAGDVLGALRFGGPIIAAVYEGLRIAEGVFKRRQADADADIRAQDASNRAYGYTQFARDQREASTGLSLALQSPADDVLALLGIGPTVKQRSADLTEQRVQSFGRVQKTPAAFGISTAERQTALLNYARKIGVAPQNLTPEQQSEALNELYDNKVNNLVPEGYLQSQAEQRGVPVVYHSDRENFRQQLQVEIATAKDEAYQKLLEGIERQRQKNLNSPEFLHSIHSSAKNLDEFRQEIRQQNADWAAETSRRSAVEYD